MRDPLDVTLVAAAALGACLGFLWWNTSPARIFMGDTGSLALGGLLSGLAIVTRTELLLVVLGGLFVVVTLSVVIQVAFFRATRRRVFRMAPLHHHFELAGWTENTVIVRFWLVTGDGRGLRDRPVLRRLARLRRPVSVTRTSGRTVLVAGLGVSGRRRGPGRCCARGARVLLTDAAEPDVVAELTGAGAHLAGRASTPCPTAPTWWSPRRAGGPDAPLLADAARRGVEVIGEPELAWRLRSRPRRHARALAGGHRHQRQDDDGDDAGGDPAGRRPPRRRRGQRRAAAGRGGHRAGGDGTPAYDVLAVELSSFQLHWSSTLAPAAAAVLNLADDHIDWHGSFAAYRDAKARILAPAPVAVADAGRPGRGARSSPAHARPGDGHPRRARTRAARRPGGRAGRPGVRGDPAGEVLLDRADAAGPGAAQHRQRAGRRRPGAGRRGGRRRGRRAAWPASPAGAHRNVLVATVDGVDYVDDSKATNPHAAGASLAAYPRVVWIAGGLLKGADVDPLVAAVAPRLAGVVLLGRDRAVIAASLARHAPTVPVVTVVSGDDDRVDTSAEATMTRGRRRRRPAGPAGRHRPAGAGGRLHGRVPRLRAPRPGVRRRRPGAGMTAGTRERSSAPGAGRRGDAGAATSGRRAGSRGRPGSTAR